MHTHQETAIDEQCAITAILQFVSVMSGKNPTIITTITHSLHLNPL